MESVNGEGRGGAVEQNIETNLHPLFFSNINKTKMICKLPGTHRDHTELRLVEIITEQKHVYFAETLTEGVY